MALLKLPLYCPKIVVNQSSGLGFDRAFLAVSDLAFGVCLSLGSVVAFGGS